MDPHRLGVDAQFRDRSLARDAVYTPAGGTPVTVRVIATRPDLTAEFGAFPAVSSSTVLEVRASEVSAPSAGDRIAINGETFIVQGQPMRDPQRLVWTLDTRPE